MKKMILKFIMLVSLMTLIVSCDSNSKDDSIQQDPPESRTQLPGEPDLLAKSATTLYLDSTPVAIETVELNSVGLKIVRTEIEFFFNENATIADINALLTKYEATIISSLPNVNALIVSIPDPGSLQLYNQILDNLSNEVLVTDVIPVTMSTGTSVVPTSLDITDEEEITKLDHHLSAGFHAAWNAKNAIKNKPNVLVYDQFGAGEPGNSTQATYKPSQFTASTPKTHGYHVLGIIGLSHNLTEGVAGAIPAPFNLEVIDIQPDIDSNRYYNEILSLALEMSKNGTVIVNSSIANACENPDGDDILCPKESLSPLAISFIRKVRLQDLESKLLIFSAAGNVNSAEPDKVNGATISHFNIAALFNDLVDSAGNPVPALTNILVIENAEQFEGLKPEAGCLTTDSMQVTSGIAGIGENVFSALDPAGTFGDLSGTSMATPQVAGLAAYISAVRPDFTAQQIISVIRSTTKTFIAGDSNCFTSKPSELIQAYDALLALDSPDSAPVRKAILDITDSGGSLEGDFIFDVNDVRDYIDIFNSAYNENPAGVLNYSRFDLNGDRYLVGDNTVPFDLNMDGDTNDRLNIDIGSTTVSLNESNVSDWDILCYYSHSFLFEGNDTDLTDYTDTLLENCGSINTKIYYQSSAFGENVIMSSEEDGSAQTRQTDIFELDYARSPSVIPGQDTIAYWGKTVRGFGSSAEFISGIYIQYDLRGSPFLVQEGGTQPSISRNLRKVAYIKTSFSNSRGEFLNTIFMSNYDGSEEQQITSDDTIDSQPSISPDGGFLAFSRYHSVDNSSIYMVDLNTMAILSVSGNSSGNAESPSWSPNSRYIAYELNETIQVIDLNTNSISMLNTATDYRSNPTWSMDGQQIAFGYQGDIYTVNIDGTNRTNITNSPDVSDLYPAWSN